MLLLEVVLLALATASASLTISRAFIFRPLRLAIIRRSGWLGELVTCPYCVSHYVAALGMVATRGMGLSAVRAVIVWFAVVALSAMATGLMAALYKHLPESHENQEEEEA